MGGASTEISSTSTDVLVEAGIWDPITISRSVRRHKLPSEAAKRYERGVDPRMSPAGVARVIQLLVDLGGGTADPAGSFFDHSVDAQPIDLPAGFVNAITGADYTDDETVAALTAIGAAVELRGSVQSHEGWTVTPPSWRPDLTDATTLVEEVARIVGYDRIPSELPVAPPGRGLTREQRLRRLTAQALADGGLTEVLSYPFLPQGVERPVRSGRRGRRACDEARQPARRRGALHAHVAHPGAHRDRAPQPRSRSHRPRDLRGRRGRAAGGRRRVRQRAAAGRRRATRATTRSTHCARASRRSRGTSARSSSAMPCCSSPVSPRFPAGSATRSPRRTRSHSRSRHRSRSSPGRTRRCTRAAPQSSARTAMTVGYAGELLPALAHELRPAARGRGARARPRCADRGRCDGEAGDADLGLCRPPRRT